MSDDIESRIDAIHAWLDAVDKKLNFLLTGIGVAAGIGIPWLLFTWNR